MVGRVSPSLAILEEVLFTAYADIDLAVRGMKEGAADFIVKPFENEVLIEARDKNKAVDNVINRNGGKPGGKDALYPCCEI